MRHNTLDLTPGWLKPNQKMFKYFAGLLRGSLFSIFINYKN